MTFFVFLTMSGCRAVRRAHLHYDADGLPVAVKEGGGGGGGELSQRGHTEQDCPHHQGAVRRGQGQRVFITKYLAM